MCSLISDLIDKTITGTEYPLPVYITDTDVLYMSESGIYLYNEDLSEYNKLEYNEPNKYKILKDDVIYLVNPNNSLELFNKYNTDKYNVDNYSQNNIYFILKQERYNTEYILFMIENNIIHYVSHNSKMDNNYVF